MTVEAVNMQTATPFDRLRLMIVGKEKSGKSRTAATGRKPVLFLDFDKRRESIAGFKDVFALTFSDSVKPGMQPSAYSDCLTFITMLESGATLKAIGEYYGIKDWPDVKVKTLVTDSVASLAKSGMAYALYANSDIRRSLSVGGTQIFVPAGWDAWSTEMGMVETVLMRQLGILGLDVIWIFHEQAEELPGSTSEKPIFSGRVDVFPGRYRGLQKFFNEVWRVSREGSNVPTIQVLPDYRFTAASNLDFSKIPANEMRPDISYLIERSLSGK